MSDDQVGGVVHVDANVVEDLALKSSGRGVWIGSGGGGDVQFVIVVFFFDDGLLLFVFFVGSVSFRGVAAEIAGCGFPLLPPVCASAWSVRKRRERCERKK